MSAGELPGPSRWETRVLALLFLLALALRAAAAARCAMITPDGVTFAEMARFFVEGAPHRALAYKYHPLYAFLMAMARRVVGDYGTAGQAVSVLFSSAALVPLFFLARRMAGARSAAAAAMLYAVLPYFVLLSSEVLSEGVFLFFFLAALSLYRPSAEGERLWPALLAGLSAGIAYLARPEAVGLLPALGAYSAVAALRRRSGRPLAAYALFAAAFLGAAFPYLLHVRGAMGAWMITKKKALSHLVNPGSAAGRGWLAKIGGDTGAVLNAFVQAGSFGLAFLLVPGLARRRAVDRDWRDDAYLGLVAGAWLAMGWLLMFSHGYVSKRHLVPAAVALLPVAGTGFWELHHWVARLAARPGRRRLAGRLFLAVAVALLLGGAATALKLRRADKVFEVDLARKVRAVTGPDRFIVSTMPRVPYYAGCRQIEFPPEGDADAVRDYVEREGAHYLLVDFEDPILDRFHPGFRERFLDGRGAPPGYVRRAAWRLDGRRRPIRLVLYRVTKP